MKKNNYMVPQTEVNDFEFESLMNPASVGRGSFDTSGEVEAPSRFGYLGPSY